MSNQITTAIFRQALAESVTLDKFWMNPKTGGWRQFHNTQDHIDQVQMLGIPPEEVKVAWRDKSYDALYDLAFNHGWVRGGFEGPYRVYLSCGNKKTLLKAIPELMEKFPSVSRMTLDLLDDHSEVLDHVTLNGHEEIFHYARHGAKPRLRFAESDEKALKAIVQEFSRYTKSMTERQLADKIAEAAKHFGLRAQVIRGAGKKSPSEASHIWDDIDPAFWSHYVVQVGSSVIDMTGDQFDVRIKGPQIIPVTDFRKEWLEVNAV